MMNTIATIFYVLPFGCVAVMAMGDSYLQYGALGLCAIVVIFLCGHIRVLTDKIDRKDRVLGELYEKNTKAYSRLADLLEDRPCLMKDKRIKDEAEE